MRHFKSIFGCLGFALGAALLGNSLLAQTPVGFMSVKTGALGNGFRIELAGRVFGPTEAADLCGSCQEARDFFLQARRNRRWSFVLVNTGTAETVVGALRIEKDQTLGIVHASIGGAMISWASNRNLKARRAVNLGVEAYNRCILLDG